MKKEETLSRAEKLKLARERNNNLRTVKTKAFMAARIQVLRLQHVPKWALAVALFLSKGPIRWIEFARWLISPLIMIDHLGALAILVWRNPKVHLLIKAVATGLAACLAPIILAILIVEFILDQVIFWVVLRPVEFLEGIFVNFGVGFYEIDEDQVAVWSLIMKKWGKVIEKSRWDDSGPVK